MKINGFEKIEGGEVGGMILKDLAAD